MESGVAKRAHENTERNQKPNKFFACINPRIDTQVGTQMVRSIQVDNSLVCPLPKVNESSLLTQKLPPVGQFDGPCRSIPYLFQKPHYVCTLCVCNDWLAFQKVGIAYSIRLAPVDKCVRLRYELVPGH